MAGLAGQAAAAQHDRAVRPHDGLLTFAHEAMATRFALSLEEADRVYAQQAAAAAFDELDRLEGLLSRFIDTSDIARINRLPAGHATTVAPETIACLVIAAEVSRQTGGAFDVTYASSGPWRDNRLMLDACHCEARVVGEGVRVDLGGIGKGYALDRMAQLLAEWDIATGILWASTSTVLAFGPRQFPVALGSAFGSRRRQLHRGALSASGTALQGLHIIDPHTGQPATERPRAWAAARQAAVADALSTAFMVMGEEEVAAYGRRHAGTAGVPQN